MKFLLEGKEYEAGSMPVGQVVEAEKFLGFDMDAGTGARVAVMLFVAMKRAEPDKPSNVIAAEVLRADMASFEEVEDEDPPVEAADAAETNGADPETFQTSGVLSTGSSA